MNAQPTMMVFQPPPTAHYERIDQLSTIYRLSIDHGKYLPFGYPWGLYGALLVLFYFLIPHRCSKRLYSARWMVWGLNFLYAVYTIKNTRAQGAVLAYAVGFGMAWSILWTTTMLLVYDGQTEFHRIERAFTAIENGLNSTADSRDAQPDRNGDVKKQKTDLLVWQPFPAASLRHRLDWVLDLMVNFRGVTWNWRTTNLPEPPIQMLGKSEILEGDRQNRFSRSKAETHDMKVALLRVSLWKFTAGYILVDVLKTLSLHDPYFWGVIDAQPPSYLPPPIRSSATLIRIYRLLLAEFGIYGTLQTALQLGPLFFIGILGSNIIGVRGEYWVYPPEWGRYGSVLDRGLAGWWGQWWHQTFRFFFEAPAKRSVQLCGLNPKSLPARILRLFVAFSLSGFVHGCASYTSIGDTRPLRGAFLFFFLQPLGILVQRALSRCLCSLGIEQRTPRLVVQLANLVYVHVWFFYTAPLLVEDAARGGQFLWEPVPVSFARGLGFGHVDDSWWCWNGPFYSWYRGKYAWHNGIVT